MGTVAKTSIDKPVQDQDRDMLKPDASAPFLMLARVTSDTAVGAISKYGGTMLTTSLSEKRSGPAGHLGTVVERRRRRLHHSPQP
jgi:uncharacterized membrane protein